MSLDTLFSCGEVTPADLAEDVAPSFEADARWDVIRDYLADLPDAALARVVEADRWCCALWEDGARDLVGHACAVVPTHRRGERLFYSQDLRCSLSTGAQFAFDGLAAAHGLPRVVARCQQLAADRLRQNGGVS